MFALGVVVDEASQAVIGRSLADVERALRPYRVGDYPNFVEEPADASAFFDARHGRACGKGALRPGRPVQGKPPRAARRLRITPQDSGVGTAPV
jgi:hypothetical protein